MSEKEIEKPKVLATEGELIFYLRKEGGSLMTFPHFKITWKAYKNENEDIFCYTVEGFGFTDGARDGFGADVAITLGKINVKPLKPGPQGSDADWDRFETKVEYNKDGSVILVPQYPENTRWLLPNLKIKAFEIRLTEKSIELANIIVNLDRLSAAYNIPE